MGVTKVTIIDSPEKMRNQNIGYSIIIPKLKGTVLLSEQKKDKREPYLEVKTNK